MNLILIESSEADAEGRVVLCDRRAHHIRQVLNARLGETVRIGLLDGPTGEGRIERVDGERVTLQCRWTGAAPSRPRTDLILALPRPKVMRRLWSTLAALGIGRIILVNAEKVERCYFDSHVLDAAFRRNELIRGLEQSMDTRVPDVLIRRRLKVFIEDELETCCPARQRVVASPGAPRVRDVVHGKAVSGRIVAAVGPEGGWTAYEEDLFRAHGFLSVGLGTRILRTDVACVALMTLLADATD